MIAMEEQNEKGCPQFPRERLLLYAYGELTPEESARAGRHVAACARCRAELEELAAVRAALAEPGLLEPPPSRLEAKLKEAARAKLSARFPAAGGIGRRPSRVWRGVALAGAAAVVVLMIFGIVYRVRELDRTRLAAWTDDELVVLVEEVDSWRTPALELLVEKSAVWDGEAAENGEVAVATGGEEQLESGLEAIERGLEELEASVYFY